MERRMRIGIIISTLFLAGLAWGASVWTKVHQREERQELARKSQISLDEDQARKALARLQAAWNADSSWEQQVYPANYDGLHYSIEVEHALARGRPIIVIGEITDVRRETDQIGGLIVSIESHSSTNSIDLRFSLVTTPDIAKSILTQNGCDSLAEFGTFINVATIDHVEKMQQPPDPAGNDRDYFIAHGTLHEAYATHLFAFDSMDLGGNSGR